MGEKVYIPIPEGYKYTKGDDDKDHFVNATTGHRIAINGENSILSHYDNLQSNPPINNMSNIEVLKHVQNADPMRILSSHTHVLLLLIISTVIAVIKKNIPIKPCEIPVYKTCPKKNSDYLEYSVDQHGNGAWDSIVNGLKKYGFNNNLLARGGYIQQCNEKKQPGLKAKRQEHREARRSCGDKLNPGN